ncbi:MAG TPA: translation initiation factor [Candidatus Nanoarchaeia archaeon]|nr:translation initiation factor [Candidatus Nanoarchaeia archaeon]
MNEVCTKCGLPKDLCVCETIAREEQRIKVTLIKRKFGKLITLVEGIDPKQIDLKDVAKKLKSKFACGGTVKGSVIELQGDHKYKVKDELTKLGFAKETIDVN